MDQLFIFDKECAIREQFWNLRQAILSCFSACDFDERRTTRRVIIQELLETLTAVQTIWTSQNGDSIAPAPNSLDPRDKSLAHKLQDCLCGWPDTWPLLDDFDTTQYIQSLGNGEPEQMMDLGCRVLDATVGSQLLDCEYSTSLSLCLEPHLENTLPHSVVSSAQDGLISMAKRSHPQVFQKPLEFSPISPTDSSIHGQTTQLDSRLRHTPQSMVDVSRDSDATMQDDSDSGGEDHHCQMATASPEFVRPDVINGVTKSNEQTVPSEIVAEAHEMAEMPDSSVQITDEHPRQRVMILNQSQEAQLSRRNIQQILSQKFRDPSNEMLVLLTRLFDAIASPNSVLHIKEALALARTGEYVCSRKDGNRLEVVTQALDNLDSSTAAACILRRFYLVRLLEIKVKLEGELKEAKTKSQQKTKRLLKYDTERITRLKSRQPACHSGGAHGRQSEKNRPPSKRTDSQAVETMISDIYSEFNLSEPLEREAAAYTKISKQLKSRLSCARNWYLLAQRFPGGISALIPSGRNHGISVDQVEKLSSTDFKIFLDILEDLRGPFLRKASAQVGDRIVNILNRKNEEQVFVFESASRQEIHNTKYDSSELLRLLSVTNAKQPGQRNGGQRVTQLLENPD